MMPYHAQLNVTSAHAVELLLLTADVCTYDYVCTCVRRLSLQDPMGVRQVCYSYILLHDHTYSALWVISAALVLLRSCVWKQSNIHNCSTQHTASGTQHTAHGLADVLTSLRPTSARYLVVRSYETFRSKHLQKRYVQLTKVRTRYRVNETLFYQAIQAKFVVRFEAKVTVLQSESCFSHASHRPTSEPTSPRPRCPSVSAVSS